MMYKRFAKYPDNCFVITDDNKPVIDKYLFRDFANI